MSLSTLNVLNALSKILNCIVKVHQPCMDKASVEIIDSIVGFKGDSLLKLG